MWPICLAGDVCVGLQRGQTVPNTRSDSFAWAPVDAFDQVRLAHKTGDVCWDHRRLRTTMNNPVVAFDHCPVDTFDRFRLVAYVFTAVHSAAGDAAA